MVRLLVVLFLALPDMSPLAGMVQPAPHGGALAGLRPRVIVSTDAEVYSAQDLFQTKLTTLIDAYKSECDRMQGESG